LAVCVVAFFVDAGMCFCIVRQTAENLVSGYTFQMNCKNHNSSCVGRQPYLKSSALLVIYSGLKTLSREASVMM
jgi:hypothetical protein